MGPISKDTNLGNNQAKIKEGLLDIIDSDQLPKRYGGEAGGF